MLLNRMPERRKAAMSSIAFCFWHIRFARCEKLLTESVKHGNDKRRTLVNATLTFQSPTGLNPGNKPVYYVIKLRQIFEDLCRGDSELIDTIR